MIHIWDAVVMWKSHTYKTNSSVEEWFCIDGGPSHVGGRGSTKEEAFNDLIVSLQMKNEFYIKQYNENNARIAKLKEKFKEKMEDLKKREGENG